MSLLLVSAGAFTGCTSDSPGTVSPGLNMDAGGGDGDGDTADDGECTEDNQGDVMDCNCGGMSGSSICVDGEWSKCECDEPMEDTTPTGMRCKAGYYTGSFHGMWRPGAFDLGSGITLINVDIDAKMTDKGPGLALTLEAKEDNSGGEFATFEVKNGCVTGTATAIGGIDSHPFVATLTGELNCETGDFTGNMDGVYSLFDTGTLSQWYFTGDFGKDGPKTPLTGHFYSDKEAIEDGTWDLREKQTKVDELPGAGGEGVWNAKWTSEESPPLPQACIDFIMGKTPDADAGT
jgi:hypothetical protein